MAKKGAKIIYVPSFWSDAGISNREIESRNLDALCHARSFETETAIIYVNAAGKYSENDTLIGRSQVVLPIKGAIMRIAHNKESLRLVSVPLGLLDRAANIYKIRQDIVRG